MALLLQIESATAECSVALARDGKVLAWCAAEQSFDHAARITVLIRQCLDDAGLDMQDLEGVAVSRGPGSYTALRVGASAAKGFCYAVDLPLLPVDTLLSLAWAAREQFPGALYIPMIDARRMEVYAAVYDAELVTLREARPIVIEKDSFRDILSGEQAVVFSGDGAEKCKPVLSSGPAVWSDILCDARHLTGPAALAFESGQFASIVDYNPLYIKPPNITAPRKVL